MLRACHQDISPPASQRSADVQHTDVFRSAAGGENGRAVRAEKRHFHARRSLLARHVHSGEGRQAVGGVEDRPRRSGGGDQDRCRCWRRARLGSVATAKPLITRSHPGVVRSSSPVQSGTDDAGLHRVSSRSCSRAGPRRAAHTSGTRERASPRSTRRGACGRRTTLSADVKAASGSRAARVRSSSTAPVPGLIDCRALFQTAGRLG